VTWDGAHNLVDLGGLPTTDGGVTASGRVFRSGSRESITDNGWHDAHAAGLTTIIDLRSLGEIGRRPTHPVVDETYIDRFTLVHAPTENPDDEEFQRICGPHLSHPRYYADNLAMWPEKFAAVFSGIAVASGAVLIHCGAGRDRTGMIAAMLLKLNGVTVDAIVADYADAVVRVNDHLRLNPSTHERSFSGDEFDERLADRSTTLAAWIDGFDVRRYLLDAGLTVVELDRLSTNLR
jgi:protein tyrosine/serine phosphatase